MGQVEAIREKLVVNIRGRLLQGNDMPPSCNLLFEGIFFPPTRSRVPVVDAESPLQRVAKRFLELLCEKRSCVIFHMPREALLWPPQCLPSARPGFRVRSVWPILFHGSFTDEDKEEATNLAMSTTERSTRCGAKRETNKWRKREPSRMTSRATLVVTILNVRARKEQTLESVKAKVGDVTTEDKENLQDNKEQCAQWAIGATRCDDLSAKHSFCLRLKSSAEVYGDAVVTQ